MGQWWRRRRRRKAGRRATGGGGSSSDGSCSGAGGDDGVSKGEVLIMVKVGGRGAYLLLPVEELVHFGQPEPLYKIKMIFLK